MDAACGSSLHRINKQEVEMDFQREVEKVLEARANASKHQELQMQMESFFMVRGHATMWTSVMTYPKTPKVDYYTNRHAYNGGGASFSIVRL